MFSEKMNVTFAFIRENWKPLLKYTFYLIMPVCLIQTIFMNSFIDTYISALKNMSGNNILGDSLYSVLVNYGIVIFCSMIGSAILSALVYTLMHTYATRENRLQDLTLDDFKETLTKNIWKYFIVMIIFTLAFVFVIFIMALLAYLSTMTLFLTIPLLLALFLLLLPLSLIIPVYIFERDITLIAAFKKSWKLGITTFWGMLGLIIILGIISSVVQTVTTMPWYLTVVVTMAFTIISESTINQSIIYKFIIYLLGLIQSFGMYISVIIGLIGLAFQYFHAREKVEGVTIESNISNFEEL